MFSSKKRFFTKGLKVHHYFTNLTYFGKYNYFENLCSNAN